MQDKIIKIYYDDNVIIVNEKELIKIGKFYYLDMRLENENEFIYVTSVFDSNYNSIIGPVINSVSQDDMDDFEKDNIIVFLNDKVIYYDTENYYLIDLNKIDLRNKDRKNYLYKFDSYYKIDDENIIIYTGKKAFIYNINENKIINNIYDDIVVYNDCYDAYISIENKYSSPLIITLTMDNNFNILDEVMLNNYLTIIASNDILYDKEKLIKYADSCYNNFKERDVLCKIMQ